MNVSRIIVVSLLLACLGAGPGWAKKGSQADKEVSARPKIGLALGGGGALGLSHVGVLRVLEEMRIPIDYIAGSSMGAIVGGLYASGMSPDEMEATMIGMDWWTVMKDRTAREDTQYRRKRDDSRYLMDIELGLRGWRLLMPHGLASGQKFNNVMQSLTLNAMGAADFDHLNIPFRCTGTDIQSGSLVVLTNGNLATAMRASMAVPGAFTPVLLHGKMLLDGGLVDNLPVDVVRAMGADVVIAVDVGMLASEAATNWTYESVGEILSRTYDIIRRPDQDRMAETADILITPDMTGVGASDFQAAARIIPAGRPAVEAVADSLRKYSVDEETFQTFLERQRSSNMRPMVLKSIAVTGNQRVSTPVIEAQIRSRTNSPVDVRAIENDMARVYGLGDFQTVIYDLQPENDGYDLVVHTQEKYWGPDYLRFGLRLDSDFDHSASWGALLNYSRRQLNPLGGEIQLDLQGGTDQDVELEWYQPLTYPGTLFIAPSLNYESTMMDVYSNNNRIAEYERVEQNAALDIGSQFYSWGEVRGGAYFGKIKGKLKTGADTLPEGDDYISALTARFTLDRLDDAVFATKGFYVSTRGFFAEEWLGGDLSYSKMDGSGQIVKSFQKHTFSAGGGLGHSLGSDVPLYDQFDLGGYAALPGLAPGQMRGSYYAMLNTSYRYRLGSLSPSLGDGVYAIFKGVAANAWMEPSEMALDDLKFMVGMGVGADTALGPMLLGMGMAENESPSYYFSIGTTF